MRELGDPLLWRRKGSAVLPADEGGVEEGGTGKREDCPRRVGRACERHARGWARFCKGRNVSIVSLGVLFYAVHLALFVAVVVLLGTYRWPQPPSGWLTARENESLCTDLNLLTTSYYCSASVYANRSVIPFGYVTGCTRGSTQCRTQLHTEPCPPGSTGRVVITQPNATASPYEYTVVFRGAWGAGPRTKCGAPS